MSIMLKCYHKDNSEAVYPDVLCGSSVSGKIFLDRKMVAQVWDELMVWIEKAQMQPPLAAPTEHVHNKC
jgi:hypothetical protein